MIYKGHADWVSDITADGAVLFSASKDGTARAWEISVRTNPLFLYRVLLLYSHFSPLGVCKLISATQAGFGPLLWLGKEFTPHRPTKLSVNGT